MTVIGGNVIQIPVVNDPNGGDIQTVLSESSGDVATLCKSQRINKWSKWKPVVVAKFGILTATDLVNANYGIIDIPTWTRADYMFSFLFASLADRQQHQNWWPECDQMKSTPALSLEYFNYERPSGGTSSPYRQRDFDEYYNVAEEPVKEISGNAINISPEGVMHVSFPRGAQNTRTISLSDLTYPGTTSITIGSAYFGIFARKKDGTASCAVLMMNGSNYVTMSEVLGSAYNVDVPSSIVGDTWAGTWQIFPIISKETFAPTNSTPPSTSNKLICPLPYHTKDITVSIQYAQVVITGASGYRDISDGKSIYVTVVVRNTENVARRWKVTVQLYNSSQQAVSGYEKVSNSVLCPANGTSEVTVSWSIATSAQWNQFHNGYFTAVAEIDLSMHPDIRFRRSSTWNMTQLTDSSGPTP